MNKGNVFISGASRGIGRDIAIHFANNGYKVVGTSRKNFDFDEDLNNLFPIKLDITNRDDIKDCFTELKSNDLLPSILINNAGITSDQIFLRMKDEEWDSVIETNLTGTFNLSKISLVLNSRAESAHTLNSFQKLFKKSFQLISPLETLSRFFSKSAVKL